MLVQLRNPTKQLIFDGPLSVTKLLKKLDVPRETVLVISDGTLVPGDAVLPDDAVIEVRPVISGG